MNFFNNYKRPESLALCLTTLLSGCGESSRPPTTTPIPALVVADATPCYDPGVDKDAIGSLAKTRVALASCTRKHQNVVSQYDDVRKTFGEAGEPQ